MLDKATLTCTRFFALNFLIPFVIATIVLIHLLFLHQTGSNNPLQLNKNSDKISFHPHFTVMDILGFTITIIIRTVLTLNELNTLRDQDNFTPANPLVTPVHIRPELYFLFVCMYVCISVSNRLSTLSDTLTPLLPIFPLAFT